jgi:hypothetical protein
VKCSPEQLILFYASLSSRSPRILGVTGEIWEAGIDREALLEMTVSFGVSAALDTLFSDAGIDFPGREKLRVAAADEAAATASMRALEREVAALLERSGIPSIPLKGCDLRIAEGARRVSNPMVDADILIRGEDVDRAGALLERNGFFFLGSRRGAHMNFATGDDNPRFIEVHWDMVNRRSPVQRSLFRPRMEGVWERSAPVRGIHHLSPEDLVCHLTAHAVKEYFHHPKWLADISYVLTAPDAGTDPAAMRHVAAEWNVSAALGLAIHALSAATGDPRFDDPGEFGAVRPGRLGRFIAERLLEYGGLYRLRPLLWFACAPGVRDMWSVAVGMFGYVTSRE